MVDFEYLIEVCKQNSKLFSSSVDDFLIYYADRQDKLQEEFIEKIKRFKHVFAQMPPDWVDRITSQYIVHRIFEKDGLIHKYLKRSALKELAEEERAFLEQQATVPWHFSFSIISANPYDCFFEMEDVFTESSFLLYSPAIAETLKESSRSLWFNLVGYNGQCWQTYGPVTGYKGLEPDDIFFFATEIDPKIESEEDIVHHIENNPVPYMMLASVSEVPLVFNKNAQMAINWASYSGEVTLKKPDRFETKKVGDVSRYSLNGWSEFPHYAEAYYDVKKRVSLLFSLTDEGFLQLAKQLQLNNSDLMPFPLVRINPNILSASERILKKKIVLNEYEHLFQEKVEPADKKKMDDLNALMQLIMPSINAGTAPDIESLSRKTGFARETVESIVKQLTAMFEGK